MRFGLRSLQAVLVSANIASAILLALRASAVPGFRSFPGGPELFWETMVSLGIYSLGILLFAKIAPAVPTSALQAVVLFGFLGAVVQSLQLALEQFGTLPGSWGGSFVLASMLATFLLWGAAAVKARAYGMTRLGSMGMGASAAVVSMSLTIVFGVLLDSYLAPTPLEAMRAWPEFQRSGSPDLAAFAVANVFDSAVSHLVVGPVVAFVFSGFGVLLSGAFSRRSAIES